MRLWGKVASGMMLVMAAVFAVVAVNVEASRWEAAAAAVLLLVAGWLGVPAIVRLFSSFTDDEEVLEKGLVGSATIASLEPTGWRYNRQYPIVKFNLNVEAGGAAYPIEIKQAVDPELLGRLAPGDVVAVRVHREDHKKVVIDWRETIRGANETPVGESAGTLATQTAPSSSRTLTKSLWPFLRWGFLVFGLVFLRLSCEEGYFEKGGVAVQGIVLKKTYTPGTSSVGGSGTGSPSRHTVSYRFTTKEGRTIEGRYDVLPDAWNSVKEGDPVVVEYLPESPDTNRIPDQRARSGTWSIMALVLLVASGVLFITGWRQRKARANQ